MRNRRNTRRKNTLVEKIYNKNYMIIFSILIATIIISIGIIQYRKYQDNLLLAKQSEELEKQTGEIFSLMEKDLSETKSSVEITRTTTAKIVAVGDILCQMDMIEDANSNGTYDFSSMFANITKFVKDSNLAVGTLETNFVDTKYSGTGKYNSPREFLTAIKQSGIDLVSLAHNHELDYGIDGFNKTINEVQAQNIGITGISNNEENENKEFTGIIKEVNGIKIAFLGYTYGLSNESELAKEEKAVANIYSEDLVQKDLEYAKANSNYIIVIMHWGDVKTSAISENQKNITTFLVNNGVDAILGTHPTVVEPTEIIQDSEGKNILVAYSLGNYISTFKYDDADVELILNIQIAKASGSDKAVLQKVDYTPIYVLDNGRKAENRFKLTDMKKLAKDYANGDTSKISRRTYDELITKLEKLQNIVNNR